MTIRPILTFLLGASTLAFLLAQLNHLATTFPLPLHFIAAGAYATLAALHFPHGKGLAAAFIFGLLLDARTPLPFGTNAILLATLQTTIFSIRDRIPKNEPLIRSLVATIATLIAFIALATLRSHNGASTLREIPSLIASLALTALATPWLFSLQKQIDRILLPKPSDDHIHLTKTTWLT